MNKVRKGDVVMVMSGKDRGKTGKILSVLPKERRVLIEGLGQHVRHRRPRRAREKGQRVTVPGPIALANVRLLCTTCGKPRRVGFRTGEGRKQRICKKCGIVFA